MNENHCRNQFSKFYAYQDSDAGNKIDTFPIKQFITRGKHPNELYARDFKRLM